MKMLTAALPLAGLYGSQHNAERDYAMEAIFANSHGERNPGLAARVSAWTAHGKWMTGRVDFGQHFGDRAVQPHSRLPTQTGGSRMRSQQNTSYRVTWTVEVDALSAEAAAETTQVG